MSKQIKNKQSSQKQNDILDLERDYFDTFNQFFRDPFFVKGLKDIETYIHSNIKNLNTWNVENKVALACERLVNFHVHKNFSAVEDIYASPLSSDTAFITSDAVINIDCKTYSIGTPGVTEGPGTGNKEDWKKNTVGINQTSFIQPTHQTGRNGSGPAIPVKFNLPAEDVHNNTIKPTISLILGFLYFDDGKTFKWYTDKNDEDFSHNVKLACIPNGHLSDLFNNKIINNVKSYKYKEREKNKSSKNAIGVLSFRVANKTLKGRYDSQGIYWEGFKNWTI